MAQHDIIPDEEDFADIDLYDSGLAPAERYWHAQNLKFHRLADRLGFGDVPGELHKPQ
jgi:hypothetical protein